VKLAMTLLVSDEADTVEPVIDYHLARGVDLLLVTANLATDEVLEKVTRYVDAGVASLIREESTVYAQSEWVTRMARLAAAEHGADWVMHGDADEFYWPEAGTLKEILAAVPAEYGVLEVPFCHFVPRLEADGSFLEDMTVREIRSLKPSGQAVFAKAVHRAAPGVEVSMGNHRVSGTGLEVLRAWQPIVGLHFPLRGYAQFERRATRDIRGYRHLGTATRFGPRAELHREGRLREAYEREVPGEREVQEGIQEGRLVGDQRLKRFFEERGAGAREPEGWDRDRVEALRLDARRAIVAYERHPLRFQAADLEERLERAREDRRKARRDAEEAEARSTELKAEIGALRSTWSYRLGRRVSAAAAVLRRARERVGGSGA
jgi:hypothetical protein